MATYKKLLKNRAGDTIIPVTELDNTYSTAETRVGTWIDGKPIYRKVFHITNPAKTNTNYAIVSSSLDACVALYGYMKINDGTAVPVPQTDSSSTYSVLLVNASGYLRGRFSYADGLPVSVYVTVEYTKTTD